MPLRDHFDGTLPRRSRWEPLRGMWPAALCQRLLPFLPSRYAAVPQTHAGMSIEADVLAFESAARAHPFVPNGTAAAALQHETPRWRWNWTNSIWTSTRSMSSTPRTATGWWRPSS